MINENRDGLGRYMGSRFEFNNFEEDEFWKDKKEKELIFPNHNRKSSDVITYYLSKEELNAYLNKLYNKECNTYGK